ncbi:MAG: hypothetical protein KJ042_09270 [Deltaproteobacteria bacterium]|nr:hypothetical protein [Deltaproteobacteria bacterium]
MHSIRKWSVVLAIAGLCACAQTGPPASRLPSHAGDTFACEVAIRAETSMAGRRDVYRLESAMRYAAGPGNAIRVLSRDAKAYRGDDDARPFAATPGATSPVGTGSPASGVDDARAAELAADGHALFVAALERRSKRTTEFPVRLATPDGRVRGVILTKTVESVEGSWSGDGADASAGEGAKPLPANAPTIHLPGEVVDGIRSISMIVIDGEASRVHLVIEFVWTALGDAASRYEMRVGPTAAAH